MENQSQYTVKAGAKMGTITGGVLFFIFGLLPGVYFGGYTMIILISTLTGEPLKTSIMAKTAVVIGVLFGVFGALAVFLVGGALIGMLLGYLTESLPQRKQDAKEIEN